MTGITSTRTAREAAVLAALGDGQVWSVRALMRQPGVPHDYSDVLTALFRLHAAGLAQPNGDHRLMARALTGWRLAERNGNGHHAGGGG